jgi:hypothetical protein
MHRTKEAAVSDRFGTATEGKPASVITSDMPLTLVEHRVCGVSIATLLAWQPIMFLLPVRYSGCSLQRALRTHSFPSS